MMHVRVAVQSAELEAAEFDSPHDGGCERVFLELEVGSKWLISPGRVVR